MPIDRPRFERGSAGVCSLAALVLWTAAPALAGSPKAAPEPVPERQVCTVRSIGTSGECVIVDRWPNTEIAIVGAKLQSAACRIHTGDTVVVDITNLDVSKGTLGILTSVSERLWAWFPALLFIVALILARVGRGIDGLLVGADNRFSTSKLQFAVWFGVLVFAYASTVFLRFLVGGGGLVDGVVLPANLIKIAGISVVGLVGARGITGWKTSRAKRRGTGGAELKLPADKPALRDFVTDDDSKLDLGDLQLVVVAILTVIVYLLQLGWSQTTVLLEAQWSLPDVDRFTVAIFGAGQTAYLLKKLVAEPGKG